MSLLTALLDLEDAATYDGDTPYLTRDQVTSVLPTNSSPRRWASFAPSSRAPAPK